LPDTLVIVNPKAGRGTAPHLAAAVVALAAAHGIRCQVLTTNAADQARAAARDAASRGASAVVAIGGDGTIHHVVAGINAVSATCALLPIASGQGNDTIRSLGLPNDWRQAASLLWNGRPRSIDLLRARWPDGHTDLAVNVLSAGFDAEVAATVRAARHVHGSAAYLLAAVRGIWRLRHRHLAIDLDGRSQSGAALFVVVANGGWYGGGMQIVPGAVVDDGCLDLALAGPLTRLDALRTLPRLYSGGHAGHPLFTLRRGTTVRIGGEPAPVQIDGEAVPPTPLTVTLEPHALQVLRPNP
jgi:diacylglycerol kinase (ATP)